VPATQQQQQQQTQGTLQTPAVHNTEIRQTWLGALLCGGLVGRCGRISRVAMLHGDGENHVETAAIHAFSMQMRMCNVQYEHAYCYWLWLLVCFSFA
jgi:hypothetical protein